MQNINTESIFPITTLIPFAVYSVCPMTKEENDMGIVLGGIGILTILVLIYLSWVLLKGDD